MFCAVILKNHRVNLLVEMECVKDLTEEQIRNEGICLHDIYKVFYAAPGRDDAIDFNMAEPVVFDIENSVGCFEAHIINCFGERRIANFI